MKRKEKKRSFEIHVSIVLDMVLSDKDTILKKKAFVSFASVDQKPCGKEEVVQPSYRQYKSL